MCLFRLIVDTPLFRFFSVLLLDYFVEICCLVFVLSGYVGWFVDWLVGFASVSFCGLLAYAFVLLLVVLLGVVTCCLYFF